MWTLRLRGPKGKAATVQIDPSSTLSAFCELAAEKLALRSKKNLTLRAGFPPKALTYAPADAVQSHLTNNDTVVVDCTTPGIATAAAKAEAASAASANRAAAKNARAAAAASRKATKAPATGVHSLSSGGAKAVNKRKRERGEGVRLGSTLEEEQGGGDEGGTLETPAAAEAAAATGKYRRTKALQLTSKEDIAVQLVQAVSAGGAQDRAGKFFRAATRSAVDHQYQITLATARLNAALGRKFETQELKTAQRLGDEDGQAVEMRVRFKEGVRKWKEETVALLQPLELRAIVKYVLISNGETGREMLKPFNMAQCSPRVFWSIARLYNGDVAAGLADLVPDEDWSYLDIRTRQQSQKAMEAQANEEMYRQWKRGGVEPSVTPARKTRGRASSPASRQAIANDVIEIESDDDNQTVESKPSAPVRPVTFAHGAERRALREAMARAAQTRVEVHSRAADVVAAMNAKPGRGVGTEQRLGAVTVADEDDEDVEATTAVYCDDCNKARILSLDEAETAGANADGKWSCSRLAAVGREGGCGAVDDEVEQIVGTKLANLLQKAHVHTRKDLANSSAPLVLRSLVPPLDPAYASTKAKLEAVIEEARLDEVNDAMLEIVGDADLVGLLELEKLGTPADLVDTPPDLILAALERYDDSGGHHHDLADIERWQGTAKAYLERQPWMGEWRTL